MVYSLKRFEELRSLPPEFLANLYPFNVRKEFSHNYHQYMLGSNNPVINNFFFEEVDWQTFTMKKSLSVHEKESDKSKLRTLITKLNFASILYFGRSSSKKENFTLASSFDESIYLNPGSEPCSCLACLYNENKFNDFLKKFRCWTDN
jgi:hypothetical protein